MKLWNWISLLVICIILLYANLWFEHLHTSWGVYWWYETTQVIGIIVNCITAVVVFIAAIIRLESEFPL